MDHDVIDFSVFTAAHNRPYRRFLFLQGPHGSFFATLAKAVIAEGHSVHRIHLNGGDKGDWMAGQGISYTGTPSEWQQYLAEYMFRNSITDIVFYGTNRFYHRVATILAGKLDIRVHGFEEGLLQPGRITLDPRQPDEQLADIAAAIESNAAVVTPYGDLAPAASSAASSPWRIIASALPYAANEWRYRRLFASYRSHRPLSVKAETAAWLHQALTYVWRKGVSAFRLHRLRRDASPAFVLCLQRDNDSLVPKYSDFDNMRDIIDTVMASFADHAPANATLVIKGHPFDNGAQQPEKTARMTAAALNISDRVTFIHFGQLSGMMDRMAGMVTVNSSAGLRALEHGKPVKTLGAAIYNIDGLADTAPLDQFWTAPQKPDAAVYQRFADILLRTSQMQGDFYRKDGYAAMTAAMLPLLTAEDAQEDAQSPIIDKAEASNG